MSLRLFGVNYSSVYKFIPLAAPKRFLYRLHLSTSAMSNRPNFQGGRRGGGPTTGRGGGPSRGRGGGGRGGGGRGGGRGEQRWWDPVWRAERLRQQAAEVLFIHTHDEKRMHLYFHI